MVAAAIDLERLGQARELVHAVTDDEIHEAILEEHAVREARRGDRERPRRPGAPQPRCHGCKRFRRRAPGPCDSCGFSTLTGGYA